MSQHTPAPWTLTPPSVVGHADVVFGDVTLDEKGRIVGANDGCATIVASVGKYQIADANARLIAAAPELLATLKVIADIGGDGLSLHNLLTARAVIAKAEGKR